MAETAVLPPSALNADTLPRPSVSSQELGTFTLLKAFRTDLLATIPGQAYSEPYFHRRILGFDSFVLSDSDHFDHVLNRQVDRYRRDPLAKRILEPMIGRGVLLAEGEEWRRLRRSLASPFQPRHTDRLIPAFHAEATRRIAGWADEGLRERNLLSDFRALTVAIAARAMFSIEDEARTAGLSDLMSAVERKGAAFLDWRDFLFLVLGKWVPQPPARNAFGQHWRDWVIAFLKDRPALDGVDEARDLLDLLRTARDESGAVFTPDVVVDQIGAMMAASFETTALALFWTALLLALFPERQEAIREELSTQGADAPPEPTFLRSLPTTTAFLYEALRLYPPVHNFSRQAATEDRIGDIRIPRGSSITLSPWVMHRHERYWDHPNRFDPDRFVPTDGRIAVPRAWMPFGAGPRVCIGMTFATTEIYTVLRVLLNRYRIILHGPIPKPVGRAVLLPSFEPKFELARL